MISRKKKYTIFIFVMAIITAGCGDIYQNALDSLELTDGLLAYYPMNGDTRDISGNGYEGTLKQDTTTATGTYGFADDRKGNANAALLLQPGDWTGNYYQDGWYVETNITSLKGDYTISLWIRFETPEDPLVTNQFYPIISKNTLDGAFNTHSEFNLQIGASFEISFIMGYGTAGNYFNNPIYGPHPRNSWDHLVVSINHNKVTIYKNGEVIGINLYPYERWYGDGGVNPGNLPIQIGRYNNGQIQHFCGRIDDLRIYSRALSDDEVRNLYDLEK